MRASCILDCVIYSFRQLTVLHRKLPNGNARLYLITDDLMRVSGSSSWQSVKRYPNNVFESRANGNLWLLFHLLFHNVPYVVRCKRGQQMAMQHLSKIALRQLLHPMQYSCGPSCVPVGPLTAIPLGWVCLIQGILDLGHVDLFILHTTRNRIYQQLPCKV